MPEYSGFKTLMFKSSLFVEYPTMIEYDSFVTFL